MNTPPGGGPAWPRFTEAALRDFCRRLFAAKGVPERHGAVTAENLVWANLRGVDSHGITLLPRYLSQLDTGVVLGGAAGEVVSETGSSLVYDSGYGLGQVSADRCVEHALRIARGSGMATVAARNCNHYGAAGFWGERIARAGCIGIVTCNGSAAVPPWQGKSGRLGTNPFCFAAPASGGEPWVFDMATSTVAIGKVEDARFRGEATIPARWGFLDAQGNPTTDAETAWKGMPSPIGGYKGTGLGMAMEILCAGLSGGLMSPDITTQRIGAKALRLSHGFIAIDPSRFMPAAEFAERMQELMNQIKSSEPQVARRPSSRTASFPSRSMST